MPKTFIKDKKLFWLIPFFLLLFLPAGFVNSQAIDGYVKMCVPNPTTAGSVQCYKYSYQESLCKNNPINCIYSSGLIFNDGSEIKKYYDICKQKQDSAGCYKMGVSDCATKGRYQCLVVDMAYYENLMSRPPDNFDNKDDGSGDDGEGSVGYDSSPFPSLTDPMSSVGSPQSLLGRIINIIMGIVGSLALIMFIFGGISWMTAGGNEQKVKQSIGIIVWSALGLAVIFLSYALTKLLITGVSF